MAKFVEMDERVGIFEQMEEDNSSPIILINKFSVAPEEFNQFLKGWASEAEKFKEQPGFISTQLHKGIGGSGTFVNYAVWETAAHFKNAVNKVMNQMTECQHIRLVQSHLHTCSRKLQSLGSAWNKCGLI